MVFANLEEWRASLKVKGLRLSRSKTVYLWADLSEKDNEAIVAVTLKYRGSIIQREAGIMLRILCKSY